MILSVCPNPSIDTYLYFDKFERGDVNRLAGEKQFPGGKGVHVAIAVAELEEESSVLGFWGGARGEWMLDKINLMGVNCYGPKVDENSRACYTFKTNDKYNDTEILGLGPKVTQQELKTFYAEFELLLNEAEIVVFSGSWPAGAPGDAYLPMVQMVEKEGKRAVVDTSEKYLQPLLNSGIFGIHLNSSESALITGKQDVQQQITGLSEKFQMIALTRGKEGLHLAMNNEVVKANVSIDKVHSAVGSGDCLTAGLAVGLKRKLVVVDIAKFGVACGAANCLREDLGMFYKKDVYNLLNKVEILN